MVLYEILTVGRFILVFTVGDGCGFIELYVLDMFVGIYIFHQLRKNCGPFRISTKGGSPYPGIHGRQIASKLQEGYRMPKPQHVDNKL